MFAVRFDENDGGVISNRPVKNLAPPIAPGAKRSGSKSEGGDGGEGAGQKLSKIPKQTRQFTRPPPPLPDDDGVEEGRARTDVSPCPA